MKLIVTSDFDAVLTVQEKSFVLEANAQKVEFEFEEEENISFFVYPTKEKLFPYGVKVEKQQEQLSCDSPYVRLYKVGEKNFEIVLKKFKISSFNLHKVYSKKINGFELMILEGETSLFIVKEKEEIYTFEMDYKFKEVAFDLNEDVPYFVANLKNQKFICIFCPDSEKFFAYEALGIKIEENTIEIVQDVYSHAGHGKKIVLNLKQGQVLLKEEQLLYLNQKPTLAFNPKVVPYAFFESIKLGDYNLAESYLSDDLKSNLNSGVLKEYFGDFTEVVPNNFLVEKEYYVSVLTEKLCRVFLFDLKSGKINDISLIKEYAINQKTT